METFKCRLETENDTIQDSGSLTGGKGTFFCLFVSLSALVHVCSDIFRENYCSQLQRKTQFNLT